ncbi:MAG: hypothetical protein A3C90_03550 [Candidatus Magasanikbacteria bacterium RIFCSPHIGHO2_02_FULL_51_14]|uniref:AAA+ ATPase domain-containing protein n=1 Tax=Candidatus Magasanikbacteria bacterium RIFCSPHIGHO2_02_FULL_51_14 TaxID=1798683 RepID=A0A1F6MDD7_9BACT|nr:MAG: hypothetical protein A3C90_03550 [Candidatus Magasanikbacteria bacterium RIFCSPHIGHO2_02_FULL_51_14]
MIGHENIISFFEKVIEHGNISHAYCFVGQDGVGKRTMARTVAAKLLGVAEEKLQTQPDYTEIGQEIDEKKGTLKKDISVDQIRAFRAFFSLTTFFGGYKIAVVDGAEKMNVAAANGLLKTLEEPAEKSVIFLLTDSDGALPRTIRSRCQTIYFSPVSTVAIQTALEDRGLPRHEAEEMARLSHGLPGQAFRWFEDRAVYSARKEEAARFASLWQKPLYDKIKQVEPLFGDKEDHIAARERLGNVLGIWEIAMRETLLSSMDEARSPVRRVSIEIYHLIEKARRLLGQNIHPRLLVEQILLAIP